MNCLTSDTVPPRAPPPNGARPPTVLCCLTPREREHFLPPDALAEGRDLPARVVFRDAPATTDELARILNESRAEALIGAWRLPPLPSDRAAIPHLEYFCYLAGDVRGKLPGALVAQGLRWSNWGDSIGRVVAENALMLTLMCLRRAAFWQWGMHEGGAWKDMDGAEERSLFGRRVGLYGFGAVARGLLPLLAPFGCPVAACSEGPPDDLFARHGVPRFSDLEGLCAWAEILIVAEALDERTRGSMREEHLRALDDGALVNVARGPIIEEAALLRVAAEGRLRIGLDVYHQEPLPLDHPLRALRHVCLLPHIGGPTADRRRDAGRHALRQLAGYLAGGRRGATGIANAGLHRPFLAPTSAGGMGAGRNLEEAG